MRAWLSSTLVLSLAASGCLVHERPDDDAATDSDAAPAADAWIGVEASGPDAALPSDASTPDAPSACGYSEVSIGVRVEPITMDTARCMVTDVTGAALTGVDAAPADDGIRLHFDFCPMTGPELGPDCRCDVVVTNVGTDLASTLGAATNLTVALGAGAGPLPMAYLSVTKLPTCQCDGCGCSEPLYLYAANGPPASARDVPSPMTFSEGAMVCPDGCAPGGSWRLHARGDAGEIDVPGGAQRDLGSVHVRSVHDVQVFGPCADCAFCGTHVGAWIAWVDSR